MPVENAPDIDYWYQNPIRRYVFDMADPVLECHFICKPIWCNAQFPITRQHWSYNDFPYAKRDVHVNCPGGDICARPKDHNGHLLRQGFRVDPITRTTRAYLPDDAIEYFCSWECAGCKKTSEYNKQRREAKKRGGEDGGKDGGGAAGAASTGGSKRKAEGSSQQSKRTRFYDPVRGSFVDDSGAKVRSLTHGEVLAGEDLRAEFLALTEKDPGEDDDDEDETEGEGSSKQSSLTHFAAPAA